MLYEGATILERFRLLEQLGAPGAPASTWRVASLDPDRLGGVLKLAPAGSPEAEDIEREAALLAAIPAAEAQRARIAPLLDHGEDGHWSWLLQRDVGGISLARHWAREGVGWRDVLDVGQQVAGALACLHAHGVLHRDVKEENIVLGWPEAGGLDGAGAEGTPRAAAHHRPSPGRGPACYWLVDLGIGRRLDHRSAVTMDLRGSHDRVPPEAIMAGRKVGPTGDVFVLCKVLAQALVGSPNTPWPDDVDAQLAACRLDPNHPQHLSLVRLLARGMRLDPSQRPSAAELAGSFAAIRAGRSGAPRSRWWLPVASFLAGGAMVGAVLLWPEAKAPSPIAFADASAAWNIAAPAPDAAPKEPGAAPSSGFFGNPVAVDLDGDGSAEILLPRQGRVWESTAPEHLRDLELSWTGERFDWRVSELPGAGRQVFSWQVADVDADGILDRIGQGYDEDWMYQTLLVRSGAGFEPQVLPTPHPSVIPTAQGARQLDCESWVPGLPDDQAQRWTRESIGALPTAWLDLEGDGAMELLATRDQRPTLIRWTGTEWQGESLVELSPWMNGGPPGGTMVPADMDGDGDEDLVIGAVEGSRLVFMEAMGDELVRVRGADLDALDPGEAVRESYSATLAVDLDADGLRDIVLASGGFPDKGFAGSKVFRNLGDWRFERVPLPESLASPHDGTGIVPLDVDGDGRLDLLHFSLNDRERELPTHRAWHNQGQGEHRSWPLALTLPGGGALPLGTRLEATAPRPWLQVVRDASPIYLPSWLQGALVVVLPDGRIGTVELEDGLTGPRSAQVFVPDAPHLIGPGGRQLLPGQPVQSTGNPWFHALGHGWELLLDLEPRPGSMHLWRDGVHTQQDLALYDEGLGCTGPDRCLIQLRAPGGGYAPAVLTPSTGGLQVLPTQGDMSVAHVVAHGRAWTSSAGWVRERDPTTYVELYPERLPQPKLACLSLAFDGTDLACSSTDPPRLVIYDPDSLQARLQVDLPSEGGASVLPTPHGWVVTVREGLAWIGRDGSVHITQLESPRLLGLADGQSWAVTEHRVYWLDLDTERPTGGLVAPGALQGLPIPAGAQLGLH